MYVHRLRVSVYIDTCLCLHQTDAAREDSQDRKSLPPATHERHAELAAEPRTRTELQKWRKDLPQCIGSPCTIGCGKKSKRGWRGTLFEEGAPKWTGPERERDTRQMRTGRRKRKKRGERERERERGNGRAHQRLTVTQVEVLDRERDDRGVLLDVEVVLRKTLYVQDQIARKTAERIALENTRGRLLKKNMAKKEAE